MMKKQTTPLENQNPQKRPLKKRRNKKNIPVINVSVQKGLSYDYLTDLEDFKNIIYIQSLEAIQLGVDHNLEEVELCEIAHSLRYLVLPRTQWKDALNSALTYYLEKEDYETCSDIQKMIEKI